MSIRTLNLDEVNKLGEGVKAIALPDERWDKVDIKTTNLIQISWHKQKQKRNLLILPCYSAMAFVQKALLLMCLL